MTVISRWMKNLSLLIGMAMILMSCVPTMTAMKPSEASHNKGFGNLATKEGFKFSYEFFPSAIKGPTVIYIPGGAGRSGSIVDSLASPLNRSHFNFIAFDFADPPAGSMNQQEMLKYLNNQRNSRSTWLPISGRNSAAENILRNEISSVIEFVERAPSHSPDKGIYLIGGSFGSWLSLLTVQAFPDKIKGVVFVSPSTIPLLIEQYPGAKKYLTSLTDSFGNRPALAIGSKQDIIAPFLSKTESALDAANLFQKHIGANVEVMEVSNNAHARFLIQESGAVRDKIVIWLVGNSKKAERPAPVLSVKETVTTTVAATGDNADEVAIKVVLKGLEKASNEKDVVAYKSFWTKDGIFIDGQNRERRVQEEANGPWRRAEREMKYKVTQIKLNGDHAQVKVEYSSNLREIDMVFDLVGMEGLWKIKKRDFQ
ncbi:MAG: alpha/beta fold hydrolase [Syntrophales bacterium]|nr:alpha/beta fold hydrolase [Syntrophales bacterium]